MTIRITIKNDHSTYIEPGRAVEVHQPGGLRTILWAGESHTAHVHGTQAVTVREVSSEPKTAKQAEPILQFFSIEHLPAIARAVLSLDQLAALRNFGDLASVVATFPRSAERTVTLRKLLEAKEAAVRALVGVP